MVPVGGVVVTVGTVVGGAVGGVVGTVVTAGVVGTVVAAGTVVGTVVAVVPGLLGVVVRVVPGVVPVPVPLPIVVPLPVGATLPVVTKAPVTGSVTVVGKAADGVLVTVSLVGGRVVDTPNGPLTTVGGVVGVESAAPGDRFFDPRVTAYASPPKPTTTRTAAAMSKPLCVGRRAGRGGGMCRGSAEAAVGTGIVSSLRSPPAAPEPFPSRPLRLRTCRRTSATRESAATVVAVGGATPRVASRSSADATL